MRLIVVDIKSRTGVTLRIGRRVVDSIIWNAKSTYRAHFFWPDKHPFSKFVWKVWALEKRWFFGWLFMQE